MLTTITRDDYEDYLVYLYFGTSQNYLKACINRAYRDFNRTMHGYGSFENSVQLFDEAVIQLLENLMT